MRFRGAPRSMQRSSPRRAHKAALARALVAEAAIFALVAPNFFTLANFFEITRLNAELGLLAVALTPILITGGIDLSVGAMMGLAAVCFGAAWQDRGLPIPAAAAIALADRLCRWRLERAADFASEPAAAHRHARHVLVVSRHRRRHHAGGRQLQRLSVFVPVVWGRATCGASFRRSFRSSSSCSWRTSSCCIDRCSGVRCTPSGSVQAEPATQAFRWANEWGSCICCRGSSRASRRSSTWRILVRRDRTPATATSSTRSLPSSLAEHPCSAAAAPWAEQSWGWRYYQFSRTGLQLAALPSELIGVLTGVLLVGTIAIDRLNVGPRRTVDD